MTIWRPSTTIQVKTLGIVWRGEALLASEILDDNGRVKGVRPLGGTVEFGETWQKALKREFLEELGTDIVLTNQLEVTENIYSHHEEAGHEIMFLSEVILVDQSLYDQEEIQFSEHDGTACIARWFELSELEKSKPELFPDGLLETLKKNNLRSKIF